MENQDNGRASSPPLDLSPPSGTGGSSEMEDYGQDQVMSEVHLGCPPHHSGPHISHFTILLPARNEHVDYELDSKGAEVLGLDEDGDLILPRRRKRPEESFVISIQHNITSSIPKVGLQVWRAELVLADFVLHMMYESSEFNGIVAVELGAGTGLVGMLLARFDNTVLVTDYGDEILDNCAKNVHLNAGMFHQKAALYVRELDWNSKWPPQVTENSPLHQRNGWSTSEINELQRASVLLAADVIYSDDLTDAFFSTLEALMSEGPEKVLYLALEKRYNFTVDDLDVVANGYSHFRSYIKAEEEDADLGNEWSHNFVGKRIDLTTIPKYVLEYDRGHDVEIWQIKYQKRRP